MGRNVPGEYIGFSEIIFTLYVIGAIFKKENNIKRRNPVQIFDQGSLTERGHLSHYRQQMLRLLKCSFLASPFTCLSCGGYVFIDHCVFFEVKRSGLAPSLPRFSDVAFCFNPKCGLVTAKRKDVLLFGGRKWVFGIKEVKILEPFCERGKLQKISQEELERMKIAVLARS